MKLVNKKIMLLIIAGLFVWLAIYSIQPLWWSFMDFVNPKYQDDIEKAWVNKPDGFLLGQLGSRNYAYRGNAAYILGKRSNPSTIDPLIKIVKYSRKDETRGAAIGLLANFYNEPRVKQFFMNIVSQGRKDPNYLNTMMSLSGGHNNEIYPEILSMAKDNFHTSWVVDMLEYYPEKPETIETLKKIASSDPEKYIRDKAKDVLRKLQEKK